MPDIQLSTGAASSTVGANRVVGRKPLPPPSKDLLFAPESDAEYLHFEDSANNPFAHEATTFSRVNAWWLADASLLAYWDAGPAQAIWQRAGLRSEFLSAAGSQCHIAWSDTFAIVTYRGTQPDDLQDLLDIARIKLVDWTFGGGKVHAGFLDAHNKIWPAVESTLRRLNSSRRTIWFTGHSLGGALATLSMDRFAAAAGLYTVGSPRIGNPRFATLFNERHAGRCFRYVNNRDVVTHLPPAIGFTGLYKHVDARRFIDANGTISTSSQSAMDMLTLPWTRGQIRQTINQARQGIVLPDWLIDHTPRRYAVHIWNDHASSRG